jgi:methylenetetrahydrofolate reductase (NADPH)
MENLWRAAQVLKHEEPDFVSVTYGAGGSTRDRTITIVKKIKQELGLEAMAHFTCVGATVDELRGTLDEMRDAGIENVLALRGDPPEGQAEWTKTEGGLSYSTELAELIAADYPFAIGAACFPEVHPEATDMESDLAFLRKKVEAGARFLITQLFFDNELYFDFVREARAVGIDVPIIPGIIPVTSYAQIKRFTERIAASQPERYERELAARADDADAVKDLGVAYASLQCADLLARGAPGIHFYTLNKSPATRSILAALRAARPWDRALEPV